eukprot:m.160284 g.160284  ORF g.160284 m.160284 type:complete len:247 (+) comp9848_c3_seq10:2-742(+)
MSGRDSRSSPRRRNRSRSRSPRRRSPSPRRSRSPPRRRSPRRSRSRSPPRRRDHQDGRGRSGSPGDHPWDSEKKRDGDGDGDGAPESPKAAPNFETSGLLTAETNTYKGFVIKYNEPQDAAIPKVKWRLHGFKDNEELPIIHLYRQSAYLVGRERQICEIPLDHPSISKQHAVLQFRKIPEPLTKKIRVKLYVIDLGSTNGTHLNGERIEAQRYVELKEKDLLKFGFSTREYIVLNDKSVNVDDDE